MFVVTADQRGSRRGPDRVEGVLTLLRPVPAARGFERTAGDEIQAVFDDPSSLVPAVLRLLRDGHWSVGVGIGPVETPLPLSTRAGRGPAFVLAREAVRVAKRAPQHVAVRGHDPQTAGDVDALVTLLAAAIAGRTGQAWEAVDLLEADLTQAEVAAKLGISPQAVSQRVAAARWREERTARPALVRLLERANAGTGASSGIAAGQGAA